MNASASPHPEAGTLAAFIEGRLAPDELQAMTEHLRGCPDCRMVVAETARFEEEERRPARRPAWWLAAAAAVLIAVVVAFPLYRQRQTALIAQLIEAAPKEHRSVEARLSGFPWARMRAASRGGAPPPDPADLHLAGAAGVVLEKTAGREDPQSRHSAGVANLLIGRPHESIAELERAANGSNDAHAWSDLAAAHYALAIQEEKSARLVDALAAADQALRIDPKLAEGRFNRALILERMGIREKARQAWQEYLDVDPSSAWSREASAHLRALEAQSKKLDPVQP